MYFVRISTLLYDLLPSIFFPLYFSARNHRLLHEEPSERNIELQMILSLYKSLAVWANCILQIFVSKFLMLLFQLPEIEIDPNRRVQAFASDSCVQLLYI